MKETRCPVCGQRRSRIDLAEARKMLAEGYTYREIGERFGVTRERAHAALKKDKKGKGIGNG
jgi:hypothetical protein